jgi:hypothetical protein
MVMKRKKIYGIRYMHHTLAITIWFYADGIFDAAARFWRYMKLTKANLAEIDVLRIRKDSKGDERDWEIGETEDLFD